MSARLGSLEVRLADPRAYVPSPDFTQAIHQPWTRPPFDIDPAQRVPQAGDVFHPTVPRRWQAVPSYRELWPKGFEGLRLAAAS